MEDVLPRPAPQRPLATRCRDWIEWFGLGRLVTIAVSVALVGAGGYWLVAPPAPPVEASLPMTASSAAVATTDTIGATTTTTTAAAAATPQPEPIDLVVHVAGAVVAPGIHRLDAGARVADAVLAAGGVTADAHPDAINLAAPLRDGDRIYVPSASDAITVPAGVTSVGGVGGAGGAGTVSAPGVDVVPGPVSINEATAAALDALPGVGPATAAAIVAHREQHGPFSSVDRLADVRGIGPAKLETIRPLVSL